MELREEEKDAIAYFSVANILYNQGLKDMKYLDDDELRATRELYNPDKLKIRKALNKIYKYEGDALIYADCNMLEILQDLEKTLKGDDKDE